MPMYIDTHAASVHGEAHGLLASKIIDVAPEIAEGFLGESGVRAAPTASSARWRSTSRTTRTSRSGSASAPRRGNPSRITWISLA